MRCMMRILIIAVTICIIIEASAAAAINQYTAVFHRFVLSFLSPVKYTVCRLYYVGRYSGL